LISDLIWLYANGTQLGEENIEPHLTTQNVTAAHKSIDKVGCSHGQSAPSHAVATVAHTPSPCCS
jgi:hypothetical protein